MASARRRCFILCLSLSFCFCPGLAPRAAATPPDPGLSKYFKICSRSDPNLNECAVESLNMAREHLAKGILELDLPPLDPFRGSKIVMHEGEEDFNMQLTFTNYTWRGLEDFVATSARLEFSPPFLEFVTTLKNMSVTGPYQFGGSMLTLRINGYGDSFINWGANVTHRLRLVEETRDGALHWRVGEYTWHQDVFHFRCEFRNLFRGNKRLGLYANEFLNKNWKPAYAVYAPVISKGFADALKDLVLDKFLARVPLRLLFGP